MSKLYPGKQIFPVRSPTACMLKWSWSTVNLQDAYTSSCHRVEGEYFDPDNFDSFHNTPGKILAREKMQRGEWPGNGCEYCERVERAGGNSDRVMTLEREHTADKVPPELYTDPEATHVTPTILEVYFNNTCNMSCVYCAPSVSSQINAEVERHGAFSVGDMRVEPFVKDSERQQTLAERLWKYLETDNRYQHIRHFNILGGEPLLQQEFDQCIKFWRTHPNPNLTINLVSNLNFDPKFFQKRILALKELVDNYSILQVEITASLDCFGAEQEYIRWGLDLHGRWVPNFEFLLAQSWIRPAVHSCISSLTIKSFDQLVAQLNTWNHEYDRTIDHSFDVVVGKSWQQNAMHPMFFGPGVFDTDFERIVDTMPKDTPAQRSSVEHMQGIARSIHAGTRDQQRINLLIEYLQILDKRRGTDFRQHFDWI